MQTPTIVKQTKDYMLIKVPLPHVSNRVGFVYKPKSILSPADQEAIARVREAEEDIKAGRVITAPSLTKALRRYEKEQWD